MITQKISNISIDKPLDKRAEIILAGVRVIYEKGFHGTSISSITEAAGIPKGSFYYYFSSKEEFLIQALEYYSERRYRYFETAMNDESVPPVKRIISFFREFPNRLNARDRLTLSFMHKISQELKTSHPDIIEVIDNYFLVFRKSLKACLTEAIEKGELTEGKDVQELTDFIFFAWKGTLMYMNLPGIENAIDKFCNGLERDLLV